MPERIMNIDQDIVVKFVFLKEMNLSKLLKEIKACQHCSELLPMGARPVLTASIDTRLLIVGQAPGIRVHNTGIPWNDPSGDRLRGWLGMNKEEFYNNKRIAILPMGFCYPGTGKSGDLPPRPECATLWRNRLHREMPKIELTLLIGKYAQDYYLKEKKKNSLTETIEAYEDYLAMGYLPLVHPSPRNRAWHKKNPWFEERVVPILQVKVKEVLTTK